MILDPSPLIPRSRKAMFSKIHSWYTNNPLMKTIETPQKIGFNFNNLKYWFWYIKYIVFFLLNTITWGVIYWYITNGSTWDNNNDWKNWIFRLRTNCRPQSQHTCKSTYFGISVDHIKICTVSNTIYQLVMNSDWTQVKTKTFTCTFITVQLFKQ